MKFQSERNEREHGYQVTGLVDDLDLLQDLTQIRREIIYQIATSIADKYSPIIDKASEEALSSLKKET